MYAPVFSEAILLRVVAGGVLISALVLLYLLRVRYLTNRAAAHMHARLLERERIAGELHDTLLQGIHALLLQMQSTLQGISEEGARRALECAIDRAEHVVTQARDRIAGLRVTMGLPDNVAEALQALARILAMESSVAVLVRLSGSPQPLHLDVRDEVLCIAREAIANALRHARANRVIVTVQFSIRGFTLTVEDDGCGLPTHVVAAGMSNGHFGLQGMGERARRVGGGLKIGSRPGAGTTVRLAIPRYAALRRYDRRSKWRLRWWPVADGHLPHRCIEGCSRESR